MKINMSNRSGVDANNELYQLLCNHVTLFYSHTKPSVAVFIQTKQYHDNETLTTTTKTLGEVDTFSYINGNQTSNYTTVSFASDGVQTPAVCAASKQLRKRLR